MSSFLSFVIRRGGVTDIFGVSSGTLTHLYDPEIYAGTPAAVAGFADRRLPRSHFHGRVPLAPWDGGIIVMDFDSRTQWDLQHVRPLPYLSARPDRTWVHLTEWTERGWLADGLVDPRTGEVVTPFVGTLTAGWLKTVSEAFFDRLVPDVEDFRAGVLAFEATPRVQIAPPGWTFRTGTDGSAGAAMTAELVTAGFELTTEDHAAWNTWSTEQLSEAEEAVAA